ncbi:MAG: hypothetical protein ACI9EF_000704 [Pseudohongiellaceae bacterium]
MGLEALNEHHELRWPGKTPLNAQEHHMLGLTAVLLSLCALLPSGDSQVYRDELLDLAFPNGGAPFDASGPGSGELFLRTLDTPLFLHRTVGPFDLYVMQADGLRDEAIAQQVLEDATEGLEHLVPLMEQHFSGAAGLISGRRLPLLLAQADLAEGERSFEQLVALLDWAEDDYSGWKQGRNPIWSQDLVAGLNVRTWEVQVFNLSHEFAAGHGKVFLEHGLGYYTLAHLSARLLRQGAWGLVPPWLAQGMIDELDIAAYGESWVGQDSWKRETPGWFRPGWSGFVPQGSSPPPPVFGPPKDLAVTVSKTGDSWQHRAHSGERHWDNLVLDRESEAPASFEFMALNESFLPRDRAYARCTLFLMLGVVVPDGSQNLLQLLDRVPTTPPSGMIDSDPITAIMSRALGGVPAVDDLEALSLGDMLIEIQREDIADELAAMNAKDLLRIPDHREQAEWLYSRKTDELSGADRQKIWNLILDAEYYQQLEEWRLLGLALDQGVGGVFVSSRRFPKRDRDRDRSADAFWKAMEGG